MEIVLDEGRLGMLFPAFLAVDEGLAVIAVGPTAARLDPLLVPGRPLDKHVTWSGRDLADALPELADSGTAIHLRLTASGIVLSGTVLRQGTGFVLPLTPVAGMRTDGGTSLTISDFGPADPAVSGIMLVRLQQALLDESEETAANLARERQRVLDLLTRFGRLSGYMAHDFNNLLSILHLNAQRLLRSNALGDAERRLVDIIIETARRSSDITRSLMTLAQQKNDGHTRLRVDELLDDHRSFLHTVAGAGIDVDFTHEMPGALVETSRTGLLNSIVNLVVNARDAMPQGGRVTVSTDIRTVLLPSPDDAGQPVEQTCLAIAVRDNGPGMSEDVLARAFEPLFSTKPDGRGIGLSAVMGLARESGGHACLDSAPGGGTTAYLYLPLCAEPEPAAAPEPAPDSPRPTRILLVEDEPYALEALTELLEDEGYAVTPAGSAEAAIDTLAAGLPDVVLSDVVMPGMGGLDLAAEMSVRAPGAAIILMSGYVPDSDGLRPGWQFLRKPLDTGLLRELLPPAVR